MMATSSSTTINLLCTYTCSHAHTPRRPRPHAMHAAPALSATATKQMLKTAGHTMKRRFASLRTPSSGLPEPLDSAVRSRGPASRLPRQKKLR